MAKDVIITVFANSSQAPCSQWAKEFFSEEPIVLTVPGGTGAEFRAKAITWAKTGDAFQAALNELRPDLKGTEIRRRGLVTFSVGWAFADEFLKFKAEQDRLNAYLLLDGCHTPLLDHWIRFASKAAEIKAFMAMAHSCIKPPFISSTETNKKIFVEACKLNDQDHSTPVVTSLPPDDVVRAPLPPDGITIWLSNPKAMKVWKKDPLIDFETRGDLTRLQYDGNGPHDHVYIAWYVAKRLWKWLGSAWVLY